MGNGTSIGRARGLGSAHEGVHPWLMQRFTAAGNLLLVGFLVVSILMLPSLDYQTVRNWIAEPLPALAMALLIVSVFWHARLGLNEMIGDYVHEAGNKMACVVALNLAAFGGAAFGLSCIARMALGGAA